MLLEDLHVMPGHLIRRAQQIAVAIFIEECAAYDLTPVQYATLVAVRENEGIDATRLSAIVALDRSTLGNVLWVMVVLALILPWLRDRRRQGVLAQTVRAGHE